MQVLHEKDDTAKDCAEVTEGETLEGVTLLTTPLEATQALPEESKLPVDGPEVAFWPLMDVSAVFVKPLEELGPYPWAAGMPA